MTPMATEASMDSSASDITTVSVMGDPTITRGLPPSVADNPTLYSPMSLGVKVNVPRMVSVLMITGEDGEKIPGVPIRVSVAPLGVPPSVTRENVEPTPTVPPLGPVSVSVEAA